MREKTLDARRMFLLVYYMMGRGIKTAGDKNQGRQHMRIGKTVCSLEDADLNNRDEIIIVVALPDGGPEEIALSMQEALTLAKMLLSMHQG